jgi:hypothetical protein
VFPRTRHVQDYAHLAERLKLLWGTPEFLDYVSNTALVEKDRTHRSGFPPEVVQEMLSLKCHMLRHITRFPLSDQDKVRVLEYVKKEDEWSVHARPSVKAKDLFKPKAAPRPQTKSPEPKGKGKGKGGLFGFLWR